MKLDTEAANLSNKEESMSEWRALYEESQAKRSYDLSEYRESLDYYKKDLKDKITYIEELHLKQSILTEMISTLKEEKSALKEKEARDEHRICNVRACQKRNPPSDF